MYWSGFWSQGDGASFKGTFFLKDVLQHGAPQNENIRLGVEREVEAGRVRVISDGRYSHENTMSLYEDYHEGAANPYEDDLSSLAWEAVSEAFWKAWPDYSKELLEWLRDFARQLYKDLEAEYEYQTSDERVLESLIASELLEDELHDCEECSG